MKKVKILFWIFVTITFFGLLLFTDGFRFIFGKDSIVYRAFSLLDNIKLPVISVINTDLPNEVPLWLMLMIIALGLYGFYKAFNVLFSHNQRIVKTLAIIFTVFVSFFSPIPSLAYEHFKTIVAIIFAIFLIGFIIIKIRRRNKSEGKGEYDEGRLEGKFKRYYGKLMRMLKKAKRKIKKLPDHKDKEFSHELNSLLHFLSDIMAIFEDFLRRERRKYRHKHKRLARIRSLEISVVKHLDDCKENLKKGNRKNAIHDIDVIIKLLKRYMRRKLFWLFGRKHDEGTSEEEGKKENPYESVKEIMGPKSNPNNNEVINELKRFEPELNKRIAQVETHKSLTSFVYDFIRRISFDNLKELHNVLVDFYQIASNKKPQIPENKRNIVDDLGVAMSELTGNLEMLDRAGSNVGSLIREAESVGISFNDPKTLEAILNERNLENYFKGFSELEIREIRLTARKIRRYFFNTWKDYQEVIRKYKNAKKIAKKIIS